MYPYERSWRGVTPGVPDEKGQGAVRRRPCNSDHWQQPRAEMFPWRTDFYFFAQIKISSYQLLQLPVLASSLTAE